MSRVRQTEKRLSESRRTATTGSHQKEAPSARGRALGAVGRKPSVKSRYELLGLPRSGWCSAVSVIQRLHSRQLKVWSSARPFVAGTFRAKRRARPQLGQAG